MTIIEFVGQAALDHPSDDRLHRGRIGDHGVQARTFDAMGGEGALHRADDVAAFAHTPQGLLAVRRERPAPCPQLARQAQPAKRLQSARPQGLLERIARERDDDAPGVEIAKEPPIEARQPLLRHLRTKPVFDLDVAARTQVERDEFGGALPHPLREIVARDDEVLPAIVLSAHDDMGVRMGGVEVIDRDPIQLRPEILFDLRHQAARQGFEIVVGCAVLGRDDEAHVVAVAVLTVEKGPAVDIVPVPRIESARSPVPRRSVAFDVAQVRERRSEPLGTVEAHDARLDDHPALTQRREAVA
ncbi:hypothetical protein D3C73_609440 [compost metagenome]